MKSNLLSFTNIKESDLHLSQMIANLAERLIEKGANVGCERCMSTSFTILPGLGRVILIKEKEKTKKLYETKDETHFFMIVCNNCGNMIFHNMGALCSWYKEK